MLRLDRDTASRKGAGAQVVADFESGRADILVGTQLVAKGLHFPRLTLVGVISPDLMLNLPDFRAAERAFSLVAQVAGRAGRGQQAGRVIVQTWQPDHYALEAARTHDYDAFYARETVSAASWTTRRSSISSRCGSTAPTRPASARPPTTSAPGCGNCSPARRNPAPATSWARSPRRWRRSATAGAR